MRLPIADVKPEGSPTHRLARSGLLHARTRLPVMLFILVMSLLTLTRLVIYLAMGDKFADATAGQVFTGFLIGLRYDAVVACMALLPLVIVLPFAPPVVVAHRAFRRPVAVYAGFVAAIALFLGVCDFYFFQEFGERINDKAVQYFHYDYVWKTLLDQYPIVPAIAVSLAVLGLFTWVFLRWGFDDRYNVTPLWQAIAWPALTAALVVLGIRGTLGPKSINTGPAFFSPSPLLTQLTLNGGFTLRQAILSDLKKSVRLKDFYTLLPEDEAFRIARETLATEHDTFLGDADNPLRRVTDSGRPAQKYNVVLVVLESMSWPYIGALGGNARLTPNLNKLAQEGVLMDHCWAVGGRTTRGFSGIVGGFPDLPGDSVTTRPAGHKGFFTLGSVLRERGYETMFVYGGQPYYDHRQAFLGGNGFSRFVFEDQFVAKTFRTHLGWCDGDLFDTAHDTFVKMGDKPFLATMLTLAFHRDYRVPEGKFEPVDPTHRRADQMNAMRYCDWAIGQFIEKAKTAEYFDRTLFVFVADHGGGYLTREPHASAYRVPFLLYAPKILGPPRRISTVCSQTDVAPTIMSLLGGSYTHTFFGSSVLDRPTDRGFALLQPGDEELFLISGDKSAVLIPPHGKPAHLFRYEAPDKLVEQDSPERRDDLARRAIALLQSADALFTRRAYNRGGNEGAKNEAAPPRP